MGAAAKPGSERLIGEFEIIARYFTRASGDSDVVLGVGDDAAVLAVDGHLAVTVDTLVAGVHFPDGMAPHLLGHRLMAVNLSDLAAMGARAALVHARVDAAVGRRVSGSTVSAAACSSSRSASASASSAAT